MRLTFRPTIPTDFVGCVRIIRDGFAYNETTWPQLLHLWNEVLTARSGESTVVEDADRPSGDRIVAFGLSCFVSDAFVQEAKTWLPPYIGRHVLERWSQGRSAILSLDEIRHANDGTGLNVLVLHYGWVESGYDSAQSTAIRNTLPQAFMETHRGYHLKEFLQEVYGAEELSILRSTGVLLRTDYAGLPTGGLPPPDREPYLVGVTPQEAQGTPLAAMIFLHSEPRLRLTTNERAMLRHALAGHTDEELARVLGVAPVTVKKRWEGIYDRAAGADDELAFLTDPLDGRRGAEKRRHLLAYLQRHPEELRP